jgi:hypothetical protein
VTHEAGLGIDQPAVVMVIRYLKANIYGTPASYFSGICQTQQPSLPISSNRLTHQGILMSQESSRKLNNLTQVS